MKCHDCFIGDLVVEIRTDKNIPEIAAHLARNKVLISEKEGIVFVKESGVTDLLDFCRDHMNPEDLFFRIGSGGWRPILEIQDILEMHWIDDVIKNEAVICYYQPIVDREGSIYAYELLSRFKREDGSLIYPNEVFAAAKARGRLYALDRLCRMTAVRHAVRINTKAFINFIPTSIYAPEFCLKSTVELASQLNIDPSRFVFEVVETEAVGDLDHLKRILNFYRERGFLYALDDVGEGYSTMEMLAEIVPQYMKLDMKFVQGVASDREKQQTAQTFLQTAVNIGSIPLAEGVESKADFKWLKEAGYQLFQGYLFGRPEPSPQETNSIAAVVKMV